MTRGAHATSGEPRLEHRSRLSPDEVRAVAALADAATRADGVPPLSEHAMLHLRYGGEEPVRNLLAWTGGQLSGYAHLDVTDTAEGWSGELAVHPDARGQGLGTLLAERLLKESPDGRLRLWAHGQHPAAAALARRLGLDRARVLWQMRRPLSEPLPPPRLPADVTIRTFVVGQDEQRWTDVNHRAFADHPDQGAWDVDEVRNREREPWFDPAGFFLAERDGELVGFHWTKVHGGSGPAAHGHEAAGEVYIVGVDPAAQGQGLGPALTLVGLHHLRSLGLEQVMLYVDEANTNAIRVYERLGFRRCDVDVCFART